MSTPELDDIKTELASQQATVAADLPDPPRERDDLQPAVAGAVKVIAAPICARYRVTALSNEEVDSVARALINLAEAYGLLEKADPKMMGWLTLTGVGMAIAGNRERLPPPESPKVDHADSAAAA